MTQDTKKYDDIILPQVGAAAVAGVPAIWIPGADGAYLAVLWGNMVNDIAKRAGHNRKAAFWAKVGSLTVSGCALYVGSIKVGLALIAWTGVGAVGSATFNAFLNSFYTWRLGRASVELFSKPGVNLEDASFVAKTLVAAIKPIPTKKDIREFQRILEDMGILQ